jgi:hypothetical protein
LDLEIALSFFKGKILMSSGIQANPEPVSRFISNAAPKTQKPLSIQQSIILIFTVLGAALLISVYSGYQKTEVPLDIAWSVSPLGLIFSHLPVEILQLEIHSFFQGRLGAFFDYFQTFLITCSLEAPFYYLALDQRNPLAFLAIVLSANFLTHPIIFFAFPAAFQHYMPSLITSEFFAASIEMLFIGYIWARRGDPHTGVRASFFILVANLFSWQIGVFL